MTHSSDLFVLLAYSSSRFLCVIMANNFLELATTLKYLGAKWLPVKKVNFTPCNDAL